MRGASFSGSLVLDARLVDLSLEVPALIDALAAAFLSPVEAPKRHHHQLPAPTDGRVGATLLLMPAWPAAAAPGDRMGVKIVGVFPDNAQHGQPTVVGSYLLMDALTGRLVAVLDGAMLTLRRTAAVSALAAKHLASPDAACLLMVGTGSLAPHMIRAHAAVRPLRDIRIWGRTPAKAQSLVATLRQESWARELDVTVADNLEAAVRVADVISCATTATSPLIDGAWIANGTHLDLVGAFNPAMCEVDAKAVAGADVWVDTLSGALAEAGDLIQAMAVGIFKADDIRGDLAQLIRRRPERTQPGRPTLFKSVGTALADLTAACLASAKYETENR